ncbi:MAG: hypothetical protein J5I93_19125 [Pirellulaceae bacterium]|nr:hypothetical protein [Pirellulaceae bacterium]
MTFQQFIDTIPILGIFAAFAIVALAVSEAGYRIGVWWQARTPEETAGPTGMIVGSLLALMAFLLAVSMGMATDRFDTRRALVLAEANAVGTAYLRAGYLPEPASGQTRALFREYLPLRIATDDLVELQVRVARSTEIQAELWTIARDLARATPDSVVLGLYIESLNEVIDLHEERVISSLYARVPESLLVLLLFGSILTLAMVGYNAGLSRRRSPLTAVVLIVVLGSVITLVFDLDRPRGGFLKVSQQPFLDLLDQVGAVPPGNDPD